MRSYASSERHKKRLWDLSPTPSISTFLVLLKNSANGHLVPTLHPKHIPNRWRASPAVWDVFGPHRPRPGAAAAVAAWRFLPPPPLLPLLSLPPLNPPPPSSQRPLTTEFQMWRR